MFKIVAWPMQHCACSVHAWLSRRPACTERAWGLHGPKYSDLFPTFVFLAGIKPEDGNF